MNTLSEFLPLIFVVAFIVISVRRSMNNQKKQEEMAKTTLPGRKSGREIPVSEVITEPANPVPFGKPRKRISIPQRQPVDDHLESVPLNEKETVDETAEPVLNIENTDDIKRAVIYTEIFNRKEY